MSDAAWSFLATLVLVLFGGGGYLQWRRTRTVEREVRPAVSNAQEAMEGLSALVPVVADLQKRLNDSERALIEVMILLAAHGEWDERVLQEIRKHIPDFPDPPPTQRRQL